MLNLNLCYEKNSFLAAYCIALFSCSSGGGTDPDVPTPPTLDKPSVDKIPINISTTITRATDTTFENGDQAGLFVVNHKTDGTPDELKPSGNYVDNMLFTYTTTWTPVTTMYWKDESTNADFYLYYPYCKSITSVGAMPFNISAGQSDVASYNLADLMIGSALNEAPTKSSVSIVAKHVMSKLEIVLKAGYGFLP